MRVSRLGFLPGLGRDFFEERPWAFAEARVHSGRSLSRIKAWAWLYDRMSVLHLPYSYRGDRLNVADPDRSFRRKSISHIVDTIRAVCELPALEKYVVHPLALDLWDGKNRGEYRAAVDGLREIVEKSVEHLKGPICLENNRVYYPEGDGERTNRVFGDEPEEWHALADDVNHPMFGLCLDTSHAVTSTLLYPEGERDGVLRAFLSRPERILHVHWSGNFPYDKRGRADSHAALGTRGTQKAWFHKEVAELGASITIEVPTIGGVEQTLAYLRRRGLWREP